MDKTSDLINIPSSLLIECRTNVLGIFIDASRYYNYIAESSPYTYVIIINATNPRTITAGICIKISLIHNTSVGIINIVRFERGYYTTPEAHNRFDTIVTAANQGKETGTLLLQMLSDSLTKEVNHQ